MGIQAVKHADRQLHSGPSNVLLWQVKEKFKAHGSVMECPIWCTEANSGRGRLQGGPQATRLGIPKNYQTSCKTASSVVSYATFNLYFKAKSCTAIHMHECCQPCRRLLKRAIDKNDQLWQHWSCSLLDQLMEWLLGYTCTGNCSQEHDQTT